MNIVQAIKSAQPNACERYRLRVEAHLPRLANDAARKAFLEGELVKWIDRFEGFQRAVANDTYRGEAQAADFHTTMADLHQMLARYAHVQPVSRMTLQPAEPA